MFIFNVRRLFPVLSILCLITVLSGCNQNFGLSTGLYGSSPLSGASREQSALRILMTAVSYFAPSSQRSMAASSDTSYSKPKPPPPKKQLPPSKKPPPPSKKPPVEQKPAGKPDLERPKLTWDAPITREDGSLLPVDDIKGYHVYYRLRHLKTFKVITISGGNTTQFPLTSFAPGAYIFAVSTLGRNGLESRISEVVSVDLI